MSLACLPWYDFEETRPFTDAFWRGLAGHLRAAGFRHVPERLAREIHHDHALERADLLLSQTCGYVAVGVGRQAVRLVGTPTYDAEGCGPGTYSSFVVVGAASDAQEIEDLRGARCSVNEPLSHSGMNVLRRMIAPLHREGRFFSSVSLSGGHLRSLELVAGGEADVAAVDCVSWALVERHRPALLDRVRILATTRLSAAPPFVTRASAPPEELARIRGAFERYLADPDAREVREALLLTSVDELSLSAYDDMLEAQHEALALGYTEMRWPETEGIMPAPGCER